MLAAFRVGALGNHSGRPQNGTASTGKLNHSNVRCRRPSNTIPVSVRIPGAPETRSFVDCYLRPNRLREGRLAEKSCKSALQIRFGWKAFRECRPAPYSAGQNSDG